MRLDSVFIVTDPDPTSKGPESLVLELTEDMIDSGDVPGITNEGYLDLGRNAKMYSTEQEALADATSRMANRAPTTRELRDAALMILRLADPGGKIPDKVLCKKGTSTLVRDAIETLAFYANPFDEDSAQALKWDAAVRVLHVAVEYRKQNGEYPN